MKAAAEHATRFTKGGRVLSVSTAAQATLREAKASLDAASKHITDVLTVVDGEAGNDEKAKASEPAADEAPDGAKSVEPMHASPSELSALLSIELATAG